MRLVKSFLAHIVLLQTHVSVKSDPHLYVLKELSSPTRRTTDRPCHTLLDAHFHTDYEYDDVLVSKQFTKYKNGINNLNPNPKSALNPKY